MSKKKVEEEIVETAKNDNWDKVDYPTYSCSTCRSYLNFRCRRHSPQGQEGWPAVFPTDWCDDHKMSKQTMAEQMEVR